ncbi:MAG TPA: uL15m family ribosomal protein [Candidatus Thermoplasmatota archaeon]|nr:uL15m family ribosomal protein [Candidatus Thermoplasmatota archaeon]
MVGAKKKSSRLRGSREHGRGKKGGRGAGLRGGRGNAGSHKHKRVTYEVKENPKTGWFGKGNIGFKRPQQVVSALETLNVSDIDERASEWIASGKASEADGVVTVDLGTLEPPVDRLLGSGQVRRKLAITVETAAKTAVAKVKKAGGSVVVKDARAPPPPAPKKGAPAAKGGAPAKPKAK